MAAAIAADPRLRPPPSVPSPCSARCARRRRRAMPRRAAPSLARDSRPARRTLGVGSRCRRSRAPRLRRPSSPSLWLRPEPPPPESIRASSRRRKTSRLRCATCRRAHASPKDEVTSAVGSGLRDAVDATREALGRRDRRNRRLRTWNVNPVGIGRRRLARIQQRRARARLFSVRRDSGARFRADGQIDLDPQLMNMFGAAAKGADQASRVGARGHHERACPRLRGHRPTAGSRAVEVRRRHVANARGRRLEIGGPRERGRRASAYLHEARPRAAPTRAASRASR